MRAFLVSDYASDKVVERKIGFADIPDLKSLSLGRHKEVKKLGNRELVAFYRVDTDAIVLMTAYWRKK